jgi:glutathione peroxidase-family protein
MQTSPTLVVVRGTLRTGLAGSLDVIDQRLTGGQEPGTNEEIAAFCSTTYSVAFPMFAKIRVGGEDQHPLYRELTRAAPRAEGDPDSFRDVLRGHGMTPSEDPDVLWNFEKFLLGPSPSGRTLSA